MAGSSSCNLPRRRCKTNGKSTKDHINLSRAHTLTDYLILILFCFIISEYNIMRPMKLGLLLLNLDSYHLSSPCLQINSTLETRVSEIRTINVHKICERHFAFLFIDKLILHIYRIDLLIGYLVFSPWYISLP